MKGCLLDCSLVRPVNLEQLFSYVLQSPADDDNEMTKFKLVFQCPLSKYVSNCVLSFCRPTLPRF